MRPSRRDNPWWLPLALVVFLAMPWLGCMPSQPPPPAMTSWVASDMVNLTEDLPQPNDDLVFDAKDRTVGLFAAGNETVSFQIVVEGGPAGVEGLKLTFSNFSGSKADSTILADRAKVFRMWPVGVSEYPAWYLRLSDSVPKPARFYDALIPSDAPQYGMPYTIKPNERLALWVDLSVPRGAVAGQYVGGVTLTANNAQPAGLTLKLRVYDFVLPDTRAMLTVGGFDHQRLFSYFLRRGGKPFVPTWLDRSDPLVRDGLVLIRQFMTLAHEHRLDLFDRSIRPVMKRDPAGAVQLNWEDYDAVVKPYLDGTAFEDRIGCPAWPGPVDETWPDPQRYGGLDSQLYRTTVSSIFAQTGKHFEQMNLADRLFVWPLHGTGGAEGYQTFAAIARLARAGWPNAMILSDLPPQPPEETLWKPTEDFSQLFDMLAPPAHMLDPKLQKTLARDGAPLRGAYLAPGLPPYMPSLDVIASPADVRAIPWLAARDGLTGLLIPDVLNWQGNPYEVAPRNEPRLFYPGNFAGLNAVVPSVRLKRLRRGLQDASYLWLLRQRGRQTVGTAITNSLARYVGLEGCGDNYLDPRLEGWAADAKSWENARRLLAEEVLSAIHPDAQTAQQVLAQRVSWQQFDEAARNVRVEQVVTHVEPVENGKDLRVRIRADVYNELSRPSQVSLKLGTLPEGFTVVKGQDQAEPLAPAERRSLELSFTGGYLPTSAEGKMAIPLEMTVDMQRRFELKAHATLLVSPSSGKPITVDGDLSDWPVRAGNSAGQFRLIGRRGAIGEGLASRQTTAFVVHDGQNLYVALRCDIPRDEPLISRPTNMVHYEQLMASGEDLVEILLDPGAKGQSAEDLYHLVIKPNGVLLAEKGVQSDPPLGKVQPWAADAKVAVRRGDNVWIVELSIPLSSFGPAGQERFWGVNFMRYATGVAESSSWSGTPRYYYSPQNLGTLFIVPAKTAP